MAAELGIPWMQQTRAPGARISGLKSEGCRTCGGARGALAAHPGLQALGMTGHPLPRSIPLQEPDAKVTFDLHRTQHQNRVAKDPVVQKEYTNSNEQRQSTRRTHTLANSQSDLETLGGKSPNHLLPEPTPNGPLAESIPGASLLTRVSPMLSSAAQLCLRHAGIGCCS